MTIGPLKPSEAQLRRRRLRAVEHANAGYTIEESARALGVATGTVGNDRMEMRRYITRPRHSRRHPGGLLPLEPYDWVTDPPAERLTPAYRVTGPVAWASALLQRLKNENGVSQTAHAARAAIQENDGHWYTQSQVAIAELVATLQQMQSAITDAGARRRAMTIAGRDDLQANPKSHAGVSRQPLPVRGDGELPGKVYAEVWRRWHAGIPLDHATAEQIAGTQNSPLDRVEQAIREFEIQYGTIEAARGSGGAS